MTAQHTPGPWKKGHAAIDKNGDGFALLIVDDDTKGLGWRSIGGVHYSKATLAGRWPNKMPDYCLITAAPDLLANALENAQAWENVLELDLLPPQHRETAKRLLADNRAAIAKATQP